MHEAAESAHTALVKPVPRADFAARGRGNWEDARFLKRLSTFYVRAGPDADRVYFTWDCACVPCTRRAARARGRAGLCALVFPVLSFVSRPMSDDRESENVCAIVAPAPRG